MGNWERNLSFTRSLKDVLASDRDLGYRIITVLPRSFDQDEIMVHEEDLSLEVGITKTRYKKIFIEVHELWVEYLQLKQLDHGVFLKDKQFALLDLYDMTLGFLITTNENHSIFLLHELVLWQLYTKSEEPQAFLSQEFEVITSYITSRLQRVNKSSSLWHLIKQVSLVHIFDQLMQGDLERIGLYRILIRRTLKSCQLHTANYYASGFLNWCIRVNFLLQILPSISDEIKQAINGLQDELRSMLTSITRSSVADMSMWLSLNVCCWERYGLGSETLDYIIFEYNTLAENLRKRALKVMNFPYVEQHVDLSISLSSWNCIRSQLEWLLSIHCTHLGPYDSIFTFAAKSSKLKELLDLLISFQKNIGVAAGGYQGGKVATQVTKDAFRAVIEKLQTKYKAL